MIVIRINITFPSPLAVTRGLSKIDNLRLICCMGYKNENPPKSVEGREKNLFENFIYI